jgi:hypothetical protein
MTKTTPLKPGQLVYKGHCVNPATFHRKTYDLQQLVGCCRDCGKVLRGTDALPAADPYDSEIKGISTKIVQCKTCREASNQEV